MTTALVTGATAGIGRAFARRLAADGRDVVLVARDEARLESLAVELRERHSVFAEVLVADLLDRAACARVEQRLREPRRPVDLLVNNAGFGLRDRFLDHPVGGEEELLDILMRVPLRLSWAAAGPMVARRRGAILNVSSVAGFLPGGTYNAAKAWVTTFSEGLAHEVRSSGVRVMALCPGFVRTEFHQRMEMDPAVVPRWMWLDADRVVEVALRDLARGRVVSVPSRRYGVLVAGTRVVPRRLLVRISRRR